MSLETYIESRVNEVHRETSSTLEQLKETVAAVRESQERMWRAIDGMSKDVQALVQKDAGTEEDEDTEPTPAVEEPALAGTSAIAQPTLEKTFPDLTFFSIPEEDEVSVKDSVTSGLFAHGSMERREVGGSSGHPAAPQFTFGGSFVVGHGGTNDMAKRHSCQKKKKNGNCHGVQR